MENLTAKMFKDQRTRKLGTIDKYDSNAVINVSSHIYAKIAGMVFD